MTEPQGFKKFLCQKIVLDMFRVYIDMNEEFVRQLHDENILTDDEFLIIGKLRWPSNRNELLQALIRKDWYPPQFHALSNVLRETQSEQLFTTISQRAQQFLEDEKLKNGEIQGTAGIKKKKKKDGQETQLILASQGRLDQFLKKNMTVQDQNAVRALLREKDEDIHQMRIENTELRMQLKAKTEENTELHNRLHTLDKAVTDLLAAVQFDSETGSVEDAVLDIKDRLEKQSIAIKALHEELDNRLRVEQDLRARLTDVTEHNTSLKELYDDKEKECVKQRTKYESEIATLKAKIADETTSSFSWRKRHLTSENYYQTTVQSLQAEINKLRVELSDLKSKYDIVDKEYGKSKQELVQVNDKTRKLLASLDLESQSEDTQVALDFARNLTYTRRRSSTHTITPHRMQNGRALETQSSTSGSTTSLSTDDSPQGIFRLSINMQPKENGTYSQGNYVSSRYSQNQRRNSIPLSPKKRSNNELSPRRRSNMYEGGGVPIGGLPPIDGRDSPDVVSTPLR